MRGSCLSTNASPLQSRFLHEPGLNAAATWFRQQVIVTWHPSRLQGKVNFILCYFMLKSRWFHFNKAYHKLQPPISKSFDCSLDDPLWLDLHYSQNGTSIYIFSIISERGKEYDYVFCGGGASSSLSLSLCLCVVYLYPSESNRTCISGSKFTSRKRGFCPGW